MTVLTAGRSALRKSVDGLVDGLKNGFKGKWQEVKGANRILPVAPELLDPKRIPATVKPSDLKKPIPAPSDTERYNVAEMMRLYDAGSQRVARLAWHWELCRRYEEGEQWLVIDDQRGVIDPRGEEDIKRWFSVNLIADFLQDVVSMVTAQRPDSTASALTDTPLDLAAANEAESILGHCSRLFRDQEMLGRITHEACRSVKCYVKSCWDDKSYALLPVYGPNGQVVRSYMAPIGEMHEEIVTGDELLWDPSARNEEEAAWVMHHRLKPLTWFQETFGEVGFYVQPDNGDAGGPRSNRGYGRTDPLLGKGSTWWRPDTAMCRELWVRPNAFYPEGRLLITGGNRQMYDGPWPYEKKDVYPFSGVQVKYDRNSPYGFNLLSDALDLQAAFNKEVIRILERLEDDKRVLSIPEGSQTGADIEEKYKDLRKMILVKYKPGFAPPALANFPPINGDHFTMLNMLLDLLKGHFGITDINKGNIPPGMNGMSGVMVELMTQNSKQKLNGLATSIESFVVRRDEWRVALYTQYATTERLLGLDDTGTQTQDSVQSFKALSAGGQTRIIVTPGSAIPKSRAGQKQEITELFQMGAFGDPLDPRTKKVFMQALEWAGGSRVLPHINQLIEEQAQAAQAMAQAAQQAQDQQAQIAQAQIQAQQAQARQAQAQIVQQREESMQQHAVGQEAVQQRSDQVHEDNQLRGAMALQQAQTEQQKAALQAQSQFVLEQQKHQNKLEEILVGGAISHKLQKDAPKPTTKPAAKAKGK